MKYKKYLLILLKNLPFWYENVKLSVNRVYKF